VITNLFYSVKYDHPTNTTTKLMFTCKIVVFFKCKHWPSSKHLFEYPNQHNLATLQQPIALVWGGAIMLTDQWNTEEVMRKQSLLLQFKSVVLITHTHTRMHIDTHPTVYTLSLSLRLFTFYTPLIKILQNPEAFWMMDSNCQSLSYFRMSVRCRVARSTAHFQHLPLLE